MSRVAKRPSSNEDDEAASTRHSKVRWREGDEMTSFREHTTASMGNNGDDTAEDAHNQDDSSSEEAHMMYDKIVAFHAPAQNNVAAACYDPESRKLFVLEDTKDTWGWDLALLILEQVRPDSIILSASAPDSFVDIVADYCKQNPPAQFDLLSHKTFSLAMSTYHLASARLPQDRPAISTDTWNRSPADHATHTVISSEDDFANNAEYGYGGDRDAGMGKLRLSMLKMGCRVNVNAPYAVCAAGALLGYLSKIQAVEFNPSEHSGFELSSIESMDLDQHMFINHDALTSLAIFDMESHASMHSDQHKSALSLNGVLNTTVTPLGRKLFHTWMLRPLVNIDRINRRLDAVQVLSSKDHSEPRKNIKRDLKNVKNVTIFCQKIKSGRASYKDWQGLIDALTAGFSIKDTIITIDVRHKMEIVERLREKLNPDVHNFLLDVVNLIDWDMSRTESRVCIRSHIDDELDRWREDYARLESLLTQMSRIIGHNLPPNLCQNVIVVYLPQLGYLVAAYNIDQTAGVPEDWEQLFKTDEVVYYKTGEMHNLDDHYGDLHNAIIDREIEWLQRLVESIDDVEANILEAGDALAEIDCLLAFAEAVERFDLKRPTLTEKPVLKIRKGFHLLQALCIGTGQYIENDTMLEGGENENMNSMMIVTGANGSGKSAYGKQVALITFMAHIGCFVPAESAEIGICDKIFTRVQTLESASKTASAFMIDLSQVSQALRGATSSSLLILDEFGKGTTPADGAGILAGVITHLLKKTKPRTVVLTHYHELFTQHFLDESLPVIFCHMKSLLMEGASHLTYFYKLTPSLSLTSNAAECALEHGIPFHVVQRAREVSECISKFQISKLIDAELTPEDVADMASAEQLTKAFLRWEIENEGADVLDQLRDLLAEPHDEGEREGIAESDSDRL